MDQKTFNTIDFNKHFDGVVILGPTASGKTNLAVQLAAKINGEIISADSRQVYRGMDVGTGKDLEEYYFNGNLIPHHLIDIVDAGDKYNLSCFVKDVSKIIPQIQIRNHIPIICGGTGLYIHTLLQNNAFVHIPNNESLRKELATKSKFELDLIFLEYSKEHFPNADRSTIKRLIRAIEIVDYLTKQNSAPDEESLKPLKAYVFGVSPEVNMRRSLITNRLKKRLKNGLIEEVETLLGNGIAPADLIYYGLEYKYVTLYLTGNMTEPEMVTKLETEIHRFAKRQMTFFRKMEKDGITIDWLDNNLSISEKTNYMIEKLKQQTLN